MNKTIFILRHAKSDWSADFNRDFDRPLNKRGNHDAKRVAQWVAQQPKQPDYVLCSPAVRARSTLEHVASCLNKTSLQIDYNDSLYLADLATLLSVIQSAAGCCQRLLLVGHNPGLEELVLYLSKTPLPLTDKGKLFTTANLAIFSVDSFAGLSEHSAALHKLVRPTDL